MLDVGDEMQFPRGPSLPALEFERELLNFDARLVARRLVARSRVPVVRFRSDDLGKGLMDDVVPANMDESPASPLEAI